MPSEEDPLLPWDKGAPEIHGSRASSLHDNSNTFNERTTEEDDQQRQQPASRGKSLEVVIYFIIYVALLLFSGKFFLGQLGDQRPEPKTLEERIDRVLSDTPLIGT
jgi:hypothetical protein